MKLDNTSGIEKYMRDSEEIAVGDKGQKANTVLLNSRRYQPPEIVQITARIYSLAGLNLCNTHIIIGNKQVTVVDTGSSVSDGEAILTHIRKITDKPIGTIIYTHSHYTKGSVPIVEERTDHPVEIVGHWKLHENFSRDLVTLRRFMRRRGLMESAALLPEAGEDADSAGSKVTRGGREGYLKPTRVIENDGTVLTIDGIRMIFHTRFTFDTDDTLLIWLPDDRVAIHNHFSSNFPNLYPIQGGRYRDPDSWLDGIDYMRTLHPLHILSTHGASTSGETAVAERLTVIRDALQFVRDQTIRGMNRHLTPTELIDFIRLPEKLAEHPFLKQTYGELSNHIQGIYSGLAGWFDGNASSIHKASEDFRAQQIIQGFGGAGAGLTMLNGALDNRQYAWAAELGSWLYTVEPDNRNVVELYAQALRKLGHLTPAWTIRNYYLSQARLIDGESAAIDGQKEIDIQTALQTDPGHFVKALSQRLIPEQVPENDFIFSITFTDIRFSCGLILRNGIAELIQNPPKIADLEIHLARQDFVSLVSSRKWPPAIDNLLFERLLPDIPTFEAFLRWFDPL